MRNHTLNNLKTITSYMLVLLIIVSNFGFAPAVRAAGGTLVINEVFSNPSGASESGLEWVEIYNPTDATVSLDGLTVEEASSPSSPSLYGAWQMPVTMVGFDGDPKNIGQADGATNGVDSALGEVELPPPPPTEIRDFYFILDGTDHVTDDLRATDSTTSSTDITFSVGFQAGSAGYPVTFTWDSSSLPADITGEVQDAFGGAVMPSVNISAGSVTVPSPHTSIKFVMRRGADAERHLEYKTFAELSGELGAHEYAVVSGSDLNNAGDSVRLVNGDTVLDQVSYGNADDGNSTDNAPVSAEGDSIGRFPDGVDSDNSSSDFYEMPPTQGEANLTQEMFNEATAETAVAAYEAGSLTTLTEVATAEGLKAAADEATALVLDSTTNATFTARISTRAATIALARTTLEATETEAVADVASVTAAKLAINGATYADLQVVSVNDQDQMTEAVQAVVDAAKNDETVVAVVTFDNSDPDNAFYNVEISKNAASDSAIITTATFSQSEADAAAAAAPDVVVTLTNADKWTLMSAPTLLNEAPTVTDDGAGAVALLVYRNGVFVVPSEGDDELVNPLSAFYVKTTGTGKVSIKFATISSPTQVSKQLNAGWNLVGTNNPGLAQNEFSSIQNTPTDAGLVTLYAPDTYNSRKDTGYVSWNESADQDLNANPITALPNNNLSEYDGYWIFMNAVKTFVKNL
ncbi:MAG: lamin tail domain-containing protein [Candidatus Sungbacteria bacterium]|uniref:Lamin tail domain-containing protein n=1 Tax=Candidatus Sungiibacteriota bacterium TaxID=2750080 RepID=A0A931YD33_9BACT|nr:lamin tail domain-containing protein [Candidatus Sungbacteria bacterium]MBI2465671.1 lamin tail domain-containing protein [Candidatus Sungbacteria bacterium]